MQRFVWIARLMPVVLAVLIAVPACNKGTTGAGTGTGPGGPGGPPGMGGRGGAASGPIGKIMDRLTKGPQSLTAVIGKELNEDPPPWDTIKPQTKEYVELAQSMSKEKPPKGSDESWQQKTAAYSKLAANLDAAVQGKDKDKALSVHKEITQSCKGCHDEHRAGPPGGFRGGPPGGFRGGPPGERPQQ